MANIQVVSKRLEDGYLADIPIVISGNRPLLLLHRQTYISPPTTEKQSKNVVTWSRYRLKEYSGNKKQGIDFTTLNKS